MSGIKDRSDGRLNSNSVVTCNSDRAARLSLSACGVTAARQVDMFARRPHADRAPALTNTITRSRATGYSLHVYRMRRREVHRGQVAGNRGDAPTADATSAARLSPRRLEWNGKNTSRRERLTESSALLVFPGRFRARLHTLRTLRGAYLIFVKIAWLAR